MNIGGSDHILRSPLKAAIAGLSDPEEIVEAVLMVLNAHRYISYRGEAIGLLSPAGRVLADLAMHPDALVKEISTRLGVTESSVTKQMTNLVRANLIERTRLGRKNRYRIPLTSLISHPDIVALLNAVLQGQKTPEEE